MSENFKTLLVVNPHSSGGRTGRNWPEVQRLTKDALGDFEFKLTTGLGEAVQITREAVKKGFEMVVSVGGDGTNNEVVNGFFENSKMINPEAVFAIICSGTGSDFIKTAGVPRDYHESVPLLKGKNFKNIDLGWMKHKDHSGKMVERHFINIASFGMGGLSDYYVNKSKKLLGGKATFLLAAARAGLFYKNQLVKFKLDNGPEMERKIFNVAVANGRYFGAGMMVAPMAELEDGTFEIVILGDLGIPERLKLSAAIRTGAHMKMPKIEHFRAQHIVVDSPEIVLLDIDGEQPGSLPAEFKVLPKIIRFKVPG